MKSVFVATSLSLALVSVAVVSDARAADDEAFMACFESVAPEGMVGAPILTLKATVATMPEKMAMGMAMVVNASARTNMEAKVAGPWFDMATMSSSSIRWDFAGEKISGSLVAPSWGAPGEVQYKVDDGKMVSQRANVCN